MEQNGACFSVVASSGEESKGRKVCPMQMYRGLVKVVTHTTVWGKVLMAFLHNRAADSHEILSECSHQ